MTTLNEYLRHKHDAFHALKARAGTPGYAPTTLTARVTAEGRSGVRRIRIRDFQILSDSPPDFVGYDLGPSSPEIALGALGSCLTHTWLIQAAAFGLPLESIEVEVQGRIDQRAGIPGHEAIPREPHGITYSVRIRTDAPDDAVAEVRAAVERVCPVLNLLRNPQTITGDVQRAESIAATSLPFAVGG
ncbi:MAG TPA: OsmC family protein [Roseomonas sp.]|jgi:uncharacterized OsmC-like protein